MSGDDITVLAGQNESGKTALLQALRDFDLPPGMSPSSTDFMPEGRFDAKPQVSVLFKVSWPDIVSALEEDNAFLPGDVLSSLESADELWVHRDLLSGTYSLDPELMALWPVVTHGSAEDNVSTEEEEESDDEYAEEDGEQVEEASGAVSDPRPLDVAEFTRLLRLEWAIFVYFDSFEGILPRDVDVALLMDAKSAKPQAVLDFITLSGLDLNKVSSLQSQDKALGNYLRSRSAEITGDFLNYWKQRVDGANSVDLRVQHVRDPKGVLKLAFFIHDEVDQYPEQRSRGFLWFLSFYLRLAAEQRDPDRFTLLLIDEPGTYLHARAQRDVLHLFEDRIVKKSQIIYSTHSPFLLPPESLHRLRVVLKTKDQGTVVLNRLTHPLLRGAEFSDTLSPVIAAIGLDIREAISFVKPSNILVEGISDRMYLDAWGKLLKNNSLQNVNIFPCTGAGTVPTFASLFIGWGLKFAVLLDRDSEGNKIKTKLERELSVDRRQIVQPNDAIAIEDMFSQEDFQRLLESLDSGLTVNGSESPSATIRRLKLDKVLLARTFAEGVNTQKIQLSKESTRNVERLLTQVAGALDH